MKRKLIIAAAVIAIIAFGFLLVHFSSDGPKPPDRVVQGKLISVWVKETLASDNYFPSTRALNEAGEDAVPFLIPALQRRDSRINSTWVWLWPHLPQFIRKRFDQPILARDVRMRAVVALREMGPPAKTAVPALVQRLSDNDGTISLHSAITLGNIGLDARSAVPALEPFLRSKSHTVRVYTANAIWKITRQPEPSLSVLEDGFKDHNARFRWAAAVFLGEMGPSAKRTIPLLEQATGDSDKEIVSLALQSLAQIGPETLPILTNSLADPDAAVRISAAVALGKLGAEARYAIPLLVKALDDHAQGRPVIMGRGGVWEVSSAATDAIRQIDPHSVFIKHPGIQ